MFNEKYLCYFQSVCTNPKPSFRDSWVPKDNLCCSNVLLTCPFSFLRSIRGGSGSSPSEAGPAWQHPSFFLRVLRAALPLQLFLLLLIGLACLVPMTEEDYSCAMANNFARSFHPMLKYMNGPPPLWSCETAGDLAGVVARRQCGFKKWQHSVWQLYISAVATTVSLSFSTGTKLVTHQYISSKLQNILSE